MSRACTHDEPRLSPSAVDELADLLHPAITAQMLTTIQRITDEAGPGPLADAWQILASALTDAREIAEAESRHRGEP